MISALWMLFIFFTHNIISVALSFSVTCSCSEVILLSVPRIFCSLVYICKLIVKLTDGISSWIERHCKYDFLYSPLQFWWINNIKDEVCPTFVANLFLRKIICKFFRKHINKTWIFLCIIEGYFLLWWKQM